MPFFSVNMKHTVESCPLFNENVKQKFKALVGKREEVAKKYDIKILSAYTSVLDHLMFYAIEAPSQQAIENYFMDTGLAFWNDIEIRLVKPIPEMIKKVTGE
jgi:hypothetical protein